MYGYSREEIQRIVNGIKEGKNYSDVVEELYPKSESQCIYECAIEYRRSFSLFETIFNVFAKKEKQAFEFPCTECLTCTDC